MHSRRHLTQLSQRALANIKFILPAEATLLRQKLSDKEIAARPDLAEERERLRSRTHIVIVVLSGAQGEKKASKDNEGETGAGPEGDGDIDRKTIDSELKSEEHALYIDKDSDKTMLTPLDRPPTVADIVQVLAYLSYHWNSDLALDLV